MGVWSDLANRTAPKGRPPTAAEAWRLRYLRAKDKLSGEQLQRCHALESKLLSILGQKATVVPGKGWAPNPDYLSPKRYFETYEQLAELLGVGDPPEQWKAEARAGILAERRTDEWRAEQESQDVGA